MEAGLQARPGRLAVLLSPSATVVALSAALQVTAHDGVGSPVADARYRNPWLFDRERFASLGKFDRYLICILRLSTRAKDFSADLSKSGGHFSWDKLEATTH